MGFADGEVRLPLARSISYPVDPNRSALAIVAENANPRLTQFRQWLGGLHLLSNESIRNVAVRRGRIRPRPAADLSNIAAWYRGDFNLNGMENEALMASLRESL